MPFLSKSELIGLKHAIARIRADVLDLKARAMAWHDFELTRKADDAAENLSVMESHVRRMLDVAAKL